MSYAKTMEGVKCLVQNELDMACEENGDRFSSDHEAFSVILEEVAETKEEFALTDYAKAVGKTEQQVRQAISHAEKRGRWSMHRRVRKDEL